MPKLIIFFSFLIALLLTLLPMPEWAVWARPEWVLLVLIYWCVYFPYRVNVGIAWAMGIILDVLTGTLLGEHALALTLVIYLVSRMNMRMRLFPLTQQSISVGIFTLLYQIIIYCIQGFLNERPPTLWYWSASVTSMLLWPWVYIMLKDCSRRFKVS